MLTPQEFYTSVVKELREQYGFGGIAVFWDEFGHKMGEVVKDPSGREGLMLQEFAECCNSSESKQLHLYLFCHRSLKEYHDVSLSALGPGNQQLEDDLRKIEGRFKQYTMKSTDVETFQLISGVVRADTDSQDWNALTAEHSVYFDTLTQKTSDLRYSVGFSQEELKATVIFGTYPLHPMAVYNLPALSEKVAQNNRTLFTCLCEDEPGSFYRYLQQTALEVDALSPPMFTVDRLWDYFSDDVRQQETTNAVYRNFEHLKTRLETDDLLGLRTLKAVSVFTVTNPARVKVTEDILAYSLDIPSTEREDFQKELARLSDLKSEQHILMQLQADGTYRLAVSSTTEPLVEKVRKLLRDTPEKLVQGPIQYLKKSLWDTFQVGKSYEATAYGDDLGVVRELLIEPVSIGQLREKLHILTQNIGTGTYVDGMLLAVLCASSREIEEAKNIALTTLADPQYQQLVLAVPREPVQLAMLLKEHQALAYLKKHEASLYAEGGELHEEWRVWNEDKSSQLTDTVNELFAPERQMLDYFWLGEPEQVMNDRQMKRLTSAVMYKVFPDCPKIGEPKLALDNFGGTWGYRKDCRDIVCKLTEKNAAEKLWQETASAQKHVIHQIFKSNGLIRKNQAGEYIL
ncbi:MAG: hypothetical protein D3904_10955, partial [Candidatus Electrothrix sp. EH2]|nr:hypothetical protein [Candidatus Electrothrix sp. EH2]